MRQHGRVTTRWDETWHRLLDWTNGQAPAERLAAQLLLASDFTEIDPSHPLGGPDGSKDVVCTKNGARFVAAVYFPRGQQTFTAIENKFDADLEGARTRAAAEAFVFVTNQELRLSEREALKAKWPEHVVVIHLEDATAILDQPSMAQVRLQFLGIEYAATGRGGLGGNAMVQGNRSFAQGGRGGRGGPYGNGMDGGDAHVVGDDSRAIGGDGGDAATADGRGGRGARGPTERYGFSSTLWGYGYGGSGADAPEFTRRLELITRIRSEYFAKFPERAKYIEAGIDAVPIEWVNQRLDELGEAWHVCWGDEGYVLPPLA